jgi:hypothetical protein
MGYLLIARPLTRAYLAGLVTCVYTAPRRAWDVCMRVCVYACTRVT